MLTFVQANVLINDEARCQVTDFGLAFMLGDPIFDLLRSGIVGTVRWSSPEALKGDPGTEADIWAWAWVAWEVCACKLHIWSKLLNKLAPDLHRTRAIRRDRRGGSGHLPYSDAAIFVPGDRKRSTFSAVD